MKEESTERLSSLFTLTQQVNGKPRIPTQQCGSIVHASPNLSLTLPHMGVCVYTFHMHISANCLFLVPTQIQGCRKFSSCISSAFKSPEAKVTFNQLSEPRCHILCPLLFLVDQKRRDTLPTQGLLFLSFYTEQFSSCVYGCV